MLACLAIFRRINKMNPQHPPLHQLHHKYQTGHPKSVQSEQSVTWNLIYSINFVRLGRFSELMNLRQVVLGSPSRGETNGGKPRQDRSSDRE